MNINLRLVIVAITISLMCSNVNAQLFYSNGAVIQNNGAVIHINGGAKFDNATALVNNGEIRTRTNPTLGDYELANNTNNSGNGKYYVENDWINSANFTANSSEVILDGVNQAIKGSQVTTFHDLTLQNSGIKTQQINAIVDITGVLKLNTSELATDVYKMEVLNPDPNAILKTPGNQGFVSSLADGKLYRATNQAVTYLFPTGSSVSSVRYRPIDIVPVSATNSMYGARLVNNIATTDGYDIVNKLDTALCVANDKYYHRINATTGSAQADYTIYFDQIIDNVWTGVSQWELPQTNLWNSTGFASPTTNYGLAGLSKAAWTFVDNTVAAGDQYVLVKTRPAPPVVTGPAGICDVKDPVDLYAQGTSVNAVINWVFPAGVTFATQGNDTVTSDWGGGSIPPGPITVTEDFLGCSSYPTTYSFNVYPSPTAKIDTSSITATGDTYAFIDSSSGVGINKWLWEFGDGVSSALQNPGHVYNKTGDFTVTLNVTNSYGCSSQTSVVVKLKEGLIYVNVFTPNGDGINDLFMFPNLGLEDDYNLKIYNRWGLLVFATEGRNVAWDGKSTTGNQAPAGTYYYILEAKSKVKDFSKNGYLTLITDQN